MTALAARKLWFAIFVLVVFGLGATAGVVVDRYHVFGGRPFGTRLRSAPPNPSEIAERMSRDLGLSADQRTRLEAVLRRNGDRLQQFRRETGARFEELRKQLDSDIASILTPEQRVKFEAHRKEREQRRRRPLGAPPPM